VTVAPGFLARGPWSADAVEAVWSDEQWAAPASLERDADAAIEALRERGSPAHDGLAARLSAWSSTPDKLTVELQPARWALRLVEEGSETARSMTALCVVRTEDGRWLAGKRAGWLATWANRWALGAGGAVEVGESPALTLTRELDEEWGLTPLRLSVEALVLMPDGLASLIGLATVANDSVPVMDPEHDEYAWWPADTDAWPEEADSRLRRLGSLLAAASS
jgi:8-oxo-dGTP pyrophosphatase MutT (NUDIX family)